MKFNPISQMLVVKDTYTCFPFIKKIIKKGNVQYRYSLNYKNIITKNYSDC